jgi:hypothetical protein
MAKAKLLLLRLLEITGDSDAYFVSGSLSFLPLLSNYRQPAHDVDAAIAQELFQARKRLFGSTERVRFLPLSEVAIAAESPLARAVAPRTGFVHVDGPDGLLDLACYRRSARGFIFSLGAGFTLEIPGEITERFRWLSWEGISYQAGPPEVAFIPKAVWYLRTEARLAEPDHSGSKHLEDIKQLTQIIDWDFVGYLLERGGLRWLGQRLPKAMRSRLDPFGVKEILSLRNHVPG